VSDAFVTGPLAGITIVEMSVALTGPMAVGMLVDQGAEAIKIEGPGPGDQGRYVGVSVAGMSAMFQVINRGKRGITVDAGTDDGRAIVLDLIENADVFVSNMRPGTIDRMGLSADVLQARNPDLVIALLSGWGTDGPYAHRRAYDAVIQAGGGLASAQMGLRDDEPAFIRHAAADKITAYTACQAITAALLARERGAGGQVVDLCMLDSVVHFLFADAASHEVLLDNEQPQVNQSFSAQQKAMRFADGFIATTPVTDREFHGLCRAFGVDSTAAELATMELRLENKDLMSAKIREVHEAAAAMTVAEAEIALEDNDVPFGVVRTVSEVADDPQVIHNETLVTHESPMLGRVQQARPPAHFRSTPAGIRGPDAPAKGEHTDEVLTEFGWGDRIDELRERGVIA
jgi:crotonobetainyl-CoA:carnitine CoA-transferase CaiB-like acyl-CoA transferase